MDAFFGTQGWSYRDWVGSFYPSGTQPRDYLRLYAACFNAVELDTTFYAIPAASTVRAWLESTPPGFQFTAKLPRSITHDRRLVDADQEVAAFLDVMSELDSKLGAILIQLPPDFTAVERPALEAFLATLPDGVRWAAEFRHRSWLNSDTYAVLREHGVAWTMADLWYMPVEPRVTANFVYVRWLGNRRQIQRMHEVQIDRRADLEKWAEVLEEVAAHDLRIYGFVNNHYSGHSPSDVRFLRARLGLPPVDVSLPHQGTLL